ncbi:SDR family NAD(P)-dependent oxidoreductase [Streptomyces sp. NPDC091280]|uniref:SDR family NAD(P)-dependent oxidoreductase n=1 Tax=Streptomyces sp. NPDC091280 TaxID=3365984 RepID=UPI00381403D5
MSDRHVFIITGAGTGIGAATTRLLTDSGHHVVASGRRAEPLKRLAEETGALPFAADAATEEGVTALVNATLAAHGRLDGLVLNAGVMIAGTALETSPDDWDTVLRTNLTGPYLLARAALPHLLSARGSVVAVSSVAALRAPTASAAYAASKAGLAMLTQSLAVDHGRQGLRANVVCPGWAQTEMADQEMDEFSGGRDRKEAYAEVTRLVPQGRAAYPVEIAQAVAWLLSSSASYVNGSVLAVDGGAIAVDVGTSAYGFRIEPRT